MSCTDDTYNENNMNALTVEIMHVIDLAPANFNTVEVFETLRHLMSVYMSGLCPECRKSYAKHLRKSAPDTLANANRMAAKAAAMEDGAPGHLH
jgi:hypothetical protein